MKILLRTTSVLVRAALFGAVVASSLMFAQTVVPPKKITLPVSKPTPVVAKPTATPAAAARTATPATATATTATTTAKPVVASTAVQKTTATTVVPATATSTTVPTTTGVTNAVSSTAATATNTSSGLGAFNPGSTAGTSGAPSSGYAQSGGDPRAPVVGQGVGNFLWPGGWTLTAYGCFRTGTRLFCDFDTTNQANIQANTSIWSGGGGVNVVDDGGKITGRHDAFFVGTDGSQFPTAYITAQPVRFIIEYDDIDQRVNSISLVLGRDRLQGVPITNMDPSQPAGRMPARPVVSGSPAQGTQTAGAAGTPGATNGLDKATQGINNINDQKQKAQNLWQSMQSVAKPH